MYIVWELLLIPSIYMAHDSCECQLSWLVRIYDSRLRHKIESYLYYLPFVFLNRKLQYV